MINLVQMSEKEYQQYRENEIKKYAQMQIDTCRWDSSDSYHKAESALRPFIPKRPFTEGLVFLTILALETGKSVGTICYGHPPNQSTHETYIYNIQICDEDQRKGYGEMALVELENMLRNDGVKTIVLDVSIHNDPAFLLYRKIGYRTTHYRMKKTL